MALYQKRLFFFTLLKIVVSGAAIAQFYYNDLLSTQLVEQRQTIYKAQQVKKITEIPIRANGEVEQKWQQWTLINRSADTLMQYRLEDEKESIITICFDKNGRISNQTENQPEQRNASIYERNENGSIKVIRNEFTDSLLGFSEKEIHQWVYDSNGIPKSMWKIVESSDSKADSIEIRFTADSLNRVVEERSFKRGKEMGFYYYYYNESGQLSDIVRYHEKWKRLIPLYLFEYEKGQLIEKRQLTGGNEFSYLSWNYRYDNSGLLIEEKLLSSNSSTGSIRFNYIFHK